MKLNLPKVTISNVKDSSPSKDSCDHSRGFVLISALSSHVQADCSTWLIDSGASRHISRYKQHLSNLVENNSHLQVIIGDDASYSVKGASNNSFELKSGIPRHLNNVLFVLIIKRNLISISTLENKGFNVAFSKGSAVAWKKDFDFSSAQIIGERHAGLCPKKNLQTLIMKHGFCSLNYSPVFPFNNSV